MDMKTTPVVLISVLLALTWIIFAVRCYTKGFIVGTFGWDDAAMFMALAWNTVFASTVLLLSSCGLAYHTADVPIEILPNALKWWWFSELSYNYATAFIKIAIGLFLLKIVVKRGQIWVIRGVMIMTTVYVLVLSFLVILQCSPPSYFWNKAQAGSCWPLRVITAGAYTHSVVLAIGDFTFAGIPAWLLWRSPMERRKKLLVGGILGLGSVAGIASLVRLRYVYQMQLTNSDFLYDAKDLIYWSYIESSVGIMAGSLVMLRPLLRSFSESFFSRTSSRKSKREQWSDPSTIGRDKESMFKANDDIMLGTFGSSCQGTNFERLESNSETDVDGLHSDEGVRPKTEVVVGSSRVLGQAQVGQS